MFIRFTNACVIEDFTHSADLTNSAAQEIYWNIVINSDLIEGIYAPYLNHPYFTVILKENNRIYSTEDCTTFVCIYYSYEEAKEEFEKIASTLCEVK